MTIRLASNADIPDVVRVIKSVYDEYGFSWDPDDYHADLYGLESHYLDQGHFFWIASGDQGVVGTTALKVFPSIPSAYHEGFVRIEGADCSLERLYVMPEHRGSGIGAALFLETLSTAKVAGRKRMEIWSDKRFEAAHRLYHRHGATVVSERICDDPDKSPEWGLAIEL